MKLHDEKSAAALLACKVSTLQAWRISGRGPRFVKIGALVRYPEAEIEKFIASRTVSSTAEADALATGGAR